jgi:Asp-tRNA(Asn)/Glu-tRNA(Gln) amidotransferase A subunit family amidase
VAIKEVYDVAGMRCSWGTKIHADRTPAHDATAVKRLKNAGAIIVGTAVSTEYAISSAGPTVNPFDHSRSPGGPSSGPAAAVVSGMVPVALGSQTVGSIVRLAAYCGVFGLKPTRGAIPGRGGMALSPRLDHPGFFTRVASDLASICRMLFG